MKFGNKMESYDSKVLNNFTKLQNVIYIFEIKGLERITWLSA